MCAFGRVLLFREQPSNFDIFAQRHAAVHDEMAVGVTPQHADISVVFLSAN
jgi:hypothetical protein